MTKKVHKRNVVALLKRTRAMFERPGSWTQGAMARDQAGFSVCVDAQNASKFCMYGGLDHIAHKTLKDARYRSDVVNAALQSLFVAAPRGATLPDPVDWNDRLGRRREEVLVAFDLAILQHEDPIFP